jgi:serine protease Do
MKRWITGAAAAAAVFAATVVLPPRSASAQAPGFLTLHGPGSAIGVTVRETTGEDAQAAKLSGPEGVVVESVRAGSPAEKAGFRVGDIVVEFDRERVRSVAHFTRVVRETPPRRTVSAIVVRGTARQTLQVIPEVTGDFTTELRDGLRLRLRGDRDQLRSFNFDVDPEQFLRRGGLGRPTLGVTLAPLTTQLAEYFGVKQGALVSAVESGSPAAEAGIRAGDVITAVNGRAVTTAADVINALRQPEAGGSVDISVTRDRKALMLKATIPNDRPVVRSGRRGLPV